MLLVLSDLYMSRAHRSIGQTRKDNVRPYEVHPRGVRRRLATVTDNPEFLAVADLHDVEEDVAPKRSVIPADLRVVFGLPERAEPWYYNLESIREVFGAGVEAGVKALTDVYTKENFPHLNRKKRKQAERERYASLLPHEKWAKLADITENLADDGDVLLADGGVEVGFNQMFIREKSLCLPYLSDTTAENEFLFAQAREILLAQAEKFKVRL